MRVLFLTVFFPPPLEGGSLVYIHNLVSHLPPDDVIVYTNSKNDHEAFDATQPYRIVRSTCRWPIHTRRGHLRMQIEWLSAVPRLVARERIDIIHAGDLFYAGSIAWLLRKLLHIPYVAYAYGEELNTLPRRTDLGGEVWRSVYRRVVSAADGLIGVSDYTIKLLESHGGDPRRAFKVVPSVGYVEPISDAEIAAVRTKYRLCCEGRVILCVGRLTERKGQDSLIRCMPDVLQEFPETRLVIVGRGPDMDRLRNLAFELGVHPSVVFTGFATAEEMAALLEICTVFAMPHRELHSGDTEGCPTVFLEAAAHAKPTIGGRAGGVSDAIVDGETGFIVDGKKSDEIAAAIKSLLRDPELARELGSRGRERVLSEFTPEIGGKRVLALSREILERKRPRWRGLR